VPKENHDIVSIMQFIFFVHVIDVDGLYNMTPSDFIADWLTTVVVDFVLAPIHSEQIPWNGSECFVFFPVWFHFHPKKKQKHHHLDGFLSDYWKTWPFVSPL